MGLSCSKRQHQDWHIVEVPNPQVPRLQQQHQQVPQPPTVFLGTVWHIVPTTRDKWKCVVRRIIALLKARKRYAYYGQILNDLTKAWHDGRPSTQALFKEFTREKGELRRNIFKTWDELNGRWYSTNKPGALGGPPIMAPWGPEYSFNLGGSVRQRPYGRTLVNQAGTPTQTTIPRTEKKPKPKPRSSPKAEATRQ